MSMAVGQVAHRNRRRRGARGARQAPITDINVTPFVDVMLVLLVIFMVTAPLLMSGVPVNLPDSRAQAVEKSENIVTVTLDKDGQLYLDDKTIDNRTLIAELESIARIDREKNRQSQIMIHADRSLNYGAVVTVIGEVNRAGLTRIALVTTGKAE